MPVRRGWLLLVIFVVVASYFAWWAMFTAINQIGGSQMALLMPIETLLSVVWSIGLLGESMQVSQGLGGALILLSALLAAQWMPQRQWWQRWRQRSA